MIITCLSLFRRSPRFYLDVQTMTLCILSPPELNDGFCRLIQPIWISQKGDQFDGAKELNRVRPRPAQRSQLARSDEQRDIFRRAVQQLCHLARQQARRNFLCRPSRQCQFSNVIAHFALGPKCVSPDVPGVG